MICAWQDFLNIVPISIRKSVDKQGRDAMTELRLRVGMPAQMVFQNQSIWLEGCITAGDLSYCINTASDYSPWSAETISDGYITARGGHRIGICGTTSVRSGQVLSIRTPASLCLRVARDFFGIAANACKFSGSVLIIGRPGSGKTTILRDLIRMRSNAGECISVVDERGEIFPFAGNSFSFPIGKQTDVMIGCSKERGINAVLRSMNPDVIAVDEITAKEDCDALLRAGWCGVKLLATAHADSVQELRCRPVYKPIIDSRLFDTVIVMRHDKSWYSERLSV